MSTFQERGDHEFNPDELLEVIQFKVAQFLVQEWDPAISRMDLVQDVVVRVLQKIGAHNPARSRLMTFVSRIVDSILVDLLREFAAQKRRPEMPVMPLDDLSDCRREHRTGAESYSSWMRDLHCDVRDEIRKLPPELASLAENLLTLDVSEIAAKFDTNRGTVHRKLQKLRMHWKNSPLRSYLDRPESN